MAILSVLTERQEGVCTCYWLYFLSTAGPCHWNERRWWQRCDLFALSSPYQCFGFFCLSSVMQTDFQQTRSLLCHIPFIFYSDEYDNDDEVNEHQPFPSLSQVISFLQLSESLYSVASDRAGDKVKAALFDPLYSQIFHAVPEHVGFNIEIKWICQMKVRIKRVVSYVPICVINVLSVI